MTKNYHSLISARTGICCITGICVFLFWLMAYPQALSYQEQYQLFLWTGDYFCHEMSVAGGLAQYIGEFIVQFYVYGWLGALLLGVVSALITYLTARQLDKKHAVLAAVPAVLLIWHMGDENVLMAYPAAILLAMAAYAALKKVHAAADIVVYPVLFWLIGPMVWLYAGLRIKDWKGALGAVYLLAIQLCCAHLILTQWPLQNVMLGIWYYRYEDIIPAMQVVIPVAMVLMVRLSRYITFDTKYIMQSITLLILAVLAITQGYDKDKYELIKQDYLIRNERWTEVVKNAESYTVKDDFWSESVNLSLAMQGQLSNRMFSFYQSGESALIMPMHRDMTSNLPSMEAFYRLGMTNECLRYAFDLQESIPQGKKSGRLTKRIIECCLVSGRYDIAEKHLRLLKKSLFYSKWAENTERFIGNDMLIASHPVYGKMRRNKFRNNFLFYYPELSKVFYQLFMSNTDNKMALEYMLGQVLLEGDANIFLQTVGAVKQFGGYASMPYTYQDAINCIQARGDLPGSLYGEYVKRAKGTSHNNELMNDESSH